MAKAKEKTTKKKGTKKKTTKKKETKKEEKKEKKEEKKEKEQKDYYKAVGRRKTSTARVRLHTQGKKEITVNKKDYKKYFPDLYLQKKIEEPLEKLNSEDKFKISILVKGGGLYSQAGACRHGIARALVELNPYFRKRLKKAGYLTRDPRMRERKKPGLKRARRAPQWKKR